MRISAVLIHSGLVQRRASEAFDVGNGGVVGQKGAQVFFAQLEESALRIEGFDVTKEALAVRIECPAVMGRTSIATPAEA